MNRKMRNKERLVKTKRNWIIKGWIAGVSVLLCTGTLLLEGCSVNTSNKMDSGAQSVSDNGVWNIAVADSDTDYDLKNQEMTGALTNDSVDVVEINDSTFPDLNFRKYVRGSFDIDGNGNLSEKEIKDAKAIYCSGMNIESLKGIEYFTELQGLYCTNNKLTDLDINHNTK